MKDHFTHVKFNIYFNVFFMIPLQSYHILIHIVGRRVLTPHYFIKTPYIAYPLFFQHTAHSGASKLTHPYKYIFMPPVMCSQQLSLLH